MSQLKNIEPGAAVTFSIMFGESLDGPTVVKIKTKTNEEICTAPSVEVALRTLIDTCLDLLSATQTVTALQRMQRVDILDLLDENLIQ